MQYHKKFFIYLHNIGSGSALPKKKTAFSFVTALAFHYICNIETKGCRTMAEIIPSEPDTDNAGAGIVTILFHFQASFCF